MGLEVFTGKVSDLVETNPPGTDPKSQGDDHLRGIKKTIIGQAIKTQVGQHATASENHFLDGSVPNEITLKRGTVDAPGTELIKALNGVLSFPNQGQSLGPIGYVKFPGGLTVQWYTITGGNIPVGGSVLTGIPWPVPFTAVFAISNGIDNTGNSVLGACAASVFAVSNTNFAIATSNSTDKGQEYGGQWVIALGRTA